MNYVIDPPVQAALPEILAGIRMGVIHAVKGVVIGQLLVAVTGLGLMLSTYSRSFLFGEFWALAFRAVRIRIGAVGPDRQAGAAR